jgi:hypothetical protein
MQMRPVRLPACLPDRLSACDHGTIGMQLQAFTAFWGSTPMDFANEKIQLVHSARRALHDTEHLAEKYMSDVSGHLAAGELLCTYSLVVGEGAWIDTHYRGM